jgi:FixJ family two-component response regulator
VSIVDDDEGARFGTSSLVRSFGWQTRIFASAEKFLESHLICETSCLIADIRMPGMSGLEMQDRLLALGYGIPTIFITAMPTAAVEAQMQAKGALGFLVKPVDAIKVEQLLNLALFRKMTFSER